MVEVLRTWKSSEHDEMQELVACPLCGARETQQVLKSRDWLFRRPGEYALVRCSSCELRFVNPRPTFEALGSHYPEGYFGYANNDEAPLFMRSMLKSYGRGLSMKRIGYIEEVRPPIEAATRIVDVGCSRAEFLFWVRELRGCTGVGVDFKEDIVRFVREEMQMPIVQGTLFDAQFDSASFDVVTMLEYIEHELDPRAVLTEARRITKPGGIVAIEIPDTEGWPARFFKSRWWNLDLPRHLIFFTPSTLERMLRECGYELIEVQRFALPFYLGTSLLYSMGYRYAPDDRFWGPFLAAVLGTPFLPLLPVSPEFLFVTAKAV